MSGGQPVTHFSPVTSCHRLRMKFPQFWTSYRRSPRDRSERMAFPMASIVLTYILSGSTVSPDQERGRWGRSQSQYRNETGEDCPRYLRWIELIMTMTWSRLNFPLSFSRNKLVSEVESTSRLGSKKTTGSMFLPSGESTCKRLR